MPCMSGTRMKHIFSALPRLVIPICVAIKLLISHANVLQMPFTLDMDFWQNGRTLQLPVRMLDWFSLDPGLHQSPQWVTKPWHAQKLPKLVSISFQGQKAKDLFKMMNCLQLLRKLVSPY